MEIIKHSDRAGNVWRFGIDCSSKQAETIRRALVGLRNMGAADLLTITGLLEADETGPIYDAVEAAALGGLAEAFPAPPQEPEQEQGTESEPVLLTVGEPERAPEIPAAFGFEKL